MDHKLKVSSIAFALWMVTIPGWSADYGIKLTTQDGSTKWHLTKLDKYRIHFEGPHPLRMAGDCYKKMTKNEILEKSC